MAAAAAAAAPVADNEVPKLLKYFGDSGSICVALRYAAAAATRVSEMRAEEARSVGAGDSPAAVKLPLDSCA